MTTSHTARPYAGAKFAEIETVNYDEQILSSHRLWEDRILLLGDEAEPDLLADHARRAFHSILEEAARRGVALDWTTTRVHIHRTDSSNELTFVTRVDVL